MNWKKALLSLFVVFQVSVVFVLPNPDSILYRETYKYFASYANTLGFNTTWRFFSPNPFMWVVEYDVIPDLDAWRGLEFETYRYPSSLQDVGTREGFNRRLNFGMFMTSQDRLLENYFGPFLCKRHPEAEIIAIYMVGRETPSIDRMKLEPSWSSITDIANIRRMKVKDFSCVSDEKEGKSW